MSKFAEIVKEWGVKPEEIVAASKRIEVRSHADTVLAGDRRRFVKLRVLHRAVQRHDAKEVVGARLGGVVRPDKTLDRVLRGGAAESSSAHPTGTVTFGFCEVEDAARLWAMNPKKTAAAMARLDELVRATVNRQGGFLFVIGGESFGAAFHRADDAAAWATDLQLGVSSEPWPGGVELRLRIGLHTGETEATANGYFGAAVNQAQRFASAGHGGQTLLSAVTVALLDRSDLPDLGAYRLDGDAAEQHIYQLGHDTHPAKRTTLAASSRQRWLVFTVAR